MLLMVLVLILLLELLLELLLSQLLLCDNHRPTTRTTNGPSHLQEFVERAPSPGGHGAGPGTWKSALAGLDG